MKCVILYLVLNVLFFGSAEWIKLPEITPKEIGETEAIYHQMKPFIENEYKIIKINSENHTKYNNGSFTSNPFLTTRLKDPSRSKLSSKNSFPSKSIEDTNFFQTATKGLSFTKENVDSAKNNEPDILQSTPKTFNNATIDKKYIDYSINGDQQGEHTTKTQQDMTTPIPQINNDNILSEPFDWKNLGRILKSIQGNLFNNIPAALHKKAEYLKNIHDTILFNIEDRINALWPRHNKRDARTHKEDSHMDFPSAESALMTISFLTFAVFLIKLVMQLINILKAKKGLYTPMVTAMGRSFVKDNSKPGLDEETTARILQLMEDFKRN